MFYLIIIIDNIADRSILQYQYEKHIIFVLKSVYSIYTQYTHA